MRVRSRILTSRYEYIPFRVPSQTQAASSLPSPSMSDNGFANIAGRRPAGCDNANNANNHFSSSFAADSPYTVPLPKGSSAQAGLPPVLAPLFASTSNFAPAPISSVPVAYTPRQFQSRPVIDTGLLPSFNNAQPYSSYVSPAETLAPSYFSSIQPVSPESLGSSGRQAATSTDASSGPIFSSVSEQIPIPGATEAGGARGMEGNETVAPDSVKRSMSSSLSSVPASNASDSAIMMADALTGSGSPWLGPTI